MLTADVGPAGVVAASGGNFGLAVGHAARSLGTTRRDLRALDVAGCEDRQGPRHRGGRPRDRRVLRRGVGGRGGATGRDRRRVDASVRPVPRSSPGRARSRLELREQVPDADTVLVAVGGGGLIGGIASWFAGSDTRVVGVEPRTSRACTMRSRPGGRSTCRCRDGPPIPSAPSGWATSRSPSRAPDTSMQVVLVDDDAILDAQRAIWRELRVFAEPGGAAALAAVRSGAYVPPERGAARRARLRRERRPDRRHRAGPDSAGARLEASLHATVDRYPRRAMTTDYERAFAFQTWVMRRTSTREHELSVGHGVLQRRLPGAIRREHGDRRPAARRVPPPMTLRRRSTRPTRGSAIARSSSRAIEDADGDRDGHGGARLRRRAAWW